MSLRFPLASSQRLGFGILAEFLAKLLAELDTNNDIKMGLVSDIHLPTRLNLKDVPAWAFIVFPVIYVSLSAHHSGYTGTLLT